MDQDPARELQFRTRAAAPRRRPPAHRDSPWPWILTALVGFGITLVLVMLLLRRTAGSDARLYQQAESSPAVAGQPVDTAQVVHVEDASAGNARAGGRIIHKCRGRGGVTAYRSDGCEEDEQLVAVTPILVADSPSPAVPVSSPEQAPAVRDTYAAVGAVIENGPHDDGARTRCERAKAYRSDARDRIGLSITYEGIQQLDEMVRQACR